MKLLSKVLSKWLSKWLSKLYGRKKGVMLMIVYENRNGLTVKELEEKGYKRAAMDLHEVFIYHSKYEGQVIAFEYVSDGTIFHINDRSKIKFIERTSEFIFYEPGYRDENRTEKETCRDIAINIKRYMFFTPYNQADLAEACGVSQATISNYIYCFDSCPTYIFIDEVYEQLILQHPEYAQDEQYLTYVKKYSDYYGHAYGE